MRKIFKYQTQNNYLRVYIVNVKNNTFASIIDINGNTLINWSTGKLGIKGSRKKTSYAQEQIIRTTLTYLLASKSKQLILYFRGYKQKFLNNLQLLLSTLIKNNIKITKIKNITSTPYNGTKQKKKRRV